MIEIVSSRKGGFKPVLLAYFTRNVRNILIVSVWIEYDYYFL